MGEEGEGGGQECRELCSEFGKICLRLPCFNAIRAINAINAFNAARAEGRWRGTR
jgi:hypothetical protein